MSTLSLKLAPQDLEALLLLSRAPGIRMHGLRPFFEEEKPPSEILERIKVEGSPSWREALAATSRIFDPAKELSRCEEFGIELIPYGNGRYPPLLKETSDPPLVLYVRGSLIESDQAAVAIVGSRHPSLYGREQAKRFGGRLAEMGLTIVSGFARGIDREAHEAALGVRYGRTIAVLGSGLDVIYPKEHQNLYEEIAERGALISEFALGTQPFAENFPKRNRIIAGLSLGALVVEAHSRSGSLITAHLAIEEGREVFALPGRVDQPGSRGVHRLIKEGATLVESPEEVLEILVAQLGALAPPLDLVQDTFNGEEERLLALFESGNLTLDQAASRSQLALPETVVFLTQLELKGVLKRRPDGRYERNRKRTVPC